MDNVNIDIGSTDENAKEEHSTNQDSVHQNDLSKEKIGMDNSTTSKGKNKKNSDPQYSVSSDPDNTTDTSKVPTEVRDMPGLNLVVDLNNIQHTEDTTDSRQSNILRRSDQKSSFDLLNPLFNLKVRITGMGTMD